MGKKFVIGTVRKRKAGTFKKTGPGHWEMLKEIVHTKLKRAGVHHNTEEAKLMQSASVKLVKYMANLKGDFNRVVADRWLDENYGHVGYRKFGTWKRLTIESAMKYIKELNALYSDQKVNNPSESLSKVKDWQATMRQSTAHLHSDVERDEWVADQFDKAKKPIRHLLYVCRELLGGTHLSMVPDDGFRGLCKTIIQKAYEHGPSGMDKDSIQRFSKAFETMLNKEASKNVVQLERAVGMVGTKKFFKENPKWFMYCITRYAMKNDGMVDMDHIETYMKNAMKIHGTKNPPAPDYDDATGAMRAHVKFGAMTPEQIKAKINARKIQHKDKMKKIYFKLKRKK